MTGRGRGARLAAGARRHAAVARELELLGDRVPHEVARVLEIAMDSGDVRAAGPWLGQFARRSPLVAMGLARTLRARGPELARLFRRVLVFQALVARWGGSVATVLAIAAALLAGWLYRGARP